MLLLRSNVEFRYSVDRGQAHWISKIMHLASNLIDNVSTIFDIVSNLVDFAIFVALVISRNQLSGIPDHDQSLA